MSSYRTAVKQLERVTRAIGYVCVYWAWLEDYIGEMILDLAPLDKERLTAKQIAQIRDIILVDADIRTKIKILRSIAFVCKWEDSWFNQVDKVLNKIDNDIRPRRNRVVHGRWFAPRGRLVRHLRRPTLKRPQAFAKLELSTEERTPVKMREVWRLGKAIIAAMIKLVRLMMRHDALQKEIDKQIREQVQKTVSQKLWADLTPDLLRLLLLAKSSEPGPRQEPPDNRPKNKGSRRPRRPRSA
jgi:hypothetical protein